MKHPTHYDFDDAIAGRDADEYSAFRRAWLSLVLAIPVGVFAVVLPLWLLVWRVL